MLERYPDRRFAFYGADTEHLKAMRARFADWHRELTEDDSLETRQVGVEAVGPRAFSPDLDGPERQLVA
ncbi:hypothetical protein [Dactylosporangium sp. NPDC051541]|uniref:hypothetical protein n=1 Tax=Dactylosporangium sp. NPDC051541 TaxID=3363977 RepID=UPI0037B1D258